MSDIKKGILIATDKTRLEPERDAIQGKQKGSSVLLEIESIRIDKLLYRIINSTGLQSSRYTQEEQHKQSGSSHVV